MMRLTGNWNKRRFFHEKNSDMYAFGSGSVTVTLALEDCRYICDQFCRRNRTGRIVFSQTAEGHALHVDCDNYWGTAFIFRTVCHRASHGSDRDRRSHVSGRVHPRHGILYPLSGWKMETVSVDIGFSIKGCLWILWRER